MADLFGDKLPAQKRHGLRVQMPREYRPTSAAARKSIEKAIPPMDARVLEYIKAQPRTCDEIEVVSGLSHQTASSAVRRLTQAERIKPSGEKRATRSGRMAIVWQTA